MGLGIAEDYSTGGAVLDSELTNPESGVFLNRGVNPLITLKNLLKFLSFEETGFSAWSDTVDYEVYDSNKKDIVTYESKIYQSKTTNNGSQPDTNPSDWLETNLDSLKIKAFAKNVEERVYSDLNISRGLINNQYIYDVGDRSEYETGSDYSGWSFDSKGSDYTVIKINEMSLEAQTDGDTANIYVINQGILLETLVLKTHDGRLRFEDVGYTFKGKGEVRFVIDKMVVKKGRGYIDSLKYKGFTIVPIKGDGDSPQSAAYTNSSNGNGLGFNISICLDSSKFIANNSKELANYFRATFEYMAFEMFHSNSEGRSNSTTKYILDKDILYNEITDLKGDTVARRREMERKKATASIQTVFDTSLFYENNFSFKRTSV